MMVREDPEPFDYLAQGLAAPSVVNFVAISLFWLHADCLPTTRVPPKSSAFCRRTNILRYSILFTLRGRHLAAINSSYLARGSAACDSPPAFLMIVARSNWEIGKCVFDWFCVIFRLRRCGGQLRVLESCHKLRRESVRGLFRRWDQGEQSGQNAWLEGSCLPILHRTLRSRPQVKIGNSDLSSLAALNEPSSETKTFHYFGFSHLMLSLWSGYTTKSTSSLSLARPTRSRRTKSLTSKNKSWTK